MERQVVSVNATKVGKSKKMIVCQSSSGKHVCVCVENGSRHT